MPFNAGSPLQGFKKKTNDSGMEFIQAAERFRFLQNEVLRTEEWPFKV